MCIHGRCRVETFGRLAVAADEDVDVEHAVLSSFVVPVPTKLRLAVRG